MSDDLFFPSRPYEVIDGGEGNDTISLAHLSGPATVFLPAAATGRSLGYGGGATLVSIENAIGTSADDRLTGGGADNALYGGDGNDGLAGGRGNDALYGEGGDDLLNGGTGNDLLDGGAGFDIVNYRSAVAGVTVFLTTAQAQDTGGGGIDRLVGVEGVAGTGFADRLTGNSAANILWGLGGDDTLVGRDGDDVLLGGEGNDIINGGAGVDTVRFSYAQNNVTVDLRTSAVQNTGEGWDRLIGIENAAGSNYRDTLIGTDGDNVLDGGVANDTLLGGGGNDRLNGGRHDDLLTGGAGADDFVFADPLGAGVDTITDFTPGEDRLLLDDAVFAGLTAETIGERIVYEDGSLSFLRTLRDGTTKEMLFAHIGEGLTLTDSDFVVI